MGNLTKKQKNTLLRIIITFVLFAGLMIPEHLGAFSALPVSERYLFVPSSISAGTAAPWYAISFVSASSVRASKFIS